MAIDLTNPQGKFGGSFQSAAGLLKDIGRIEGMRRDRQTLDRFILAKAANPGASQESILADITRQGIELDPGIGGLLQRFSGGLPEGQGSVLSQLQAQTVQTPLQRAQTEATKALATQRREGKPAFKKTPVQTQRDKDIKFLETQGKKQDDGKEVIEAQLEEARARLKALPEGTLFPIELNPDLATKFEGFVKKLKDKRIIRKKRILGFSDKVFGQEAFDAALEEAINEGLRDGINPVDMEAAFREWWNAQADADKDKAFQEFQRIEAPAVVNPAASAAPTRQQGESITGFEARTGI